MGRLRRQGRRVPSFESGWCDAASLARLRHITSAHVESFDFFLERGMREAVLDLSAMDFGLEDGPFVRLVVNSVRLGAPTKREDGDPAPLTPREARERGLSYAGALTADVTAVVGDKGQEMSFSCGLGDLPIMVMSGKCHLRGLAPQRLAELREEACETGGYFVVNGIERIIRLLQMPRRNHPAAIERSSFRNRGPSYSSKGVTMRCVRPDQSSISLTLHYLTTGGVTLRLVLRKQEFLLPAVLVLRALGDISDREVFARVLQGDSDNTFVAARLELLLRDAKQLKVSSARECRAYLGHHFRGFLPVSERTSDAEAGQVLVDKYLFVHTAAMPEKQECLLLMLRKLLCFAQDGCLPDNPDAFANHELLLPGHLMSMMLRERLEELLVGVRALVLKDYRLNRDKCLQELQSTRYLAKLFERVGGSIGARAKTFLSSGNLISQSGMDLMQVSGFTVVAERLNIFRYLSHFQSVHRGQFFTTMKTTAVRKLLPESWGFLCPVHTPDGAPCGLLNHLAKEAAVVAHPTSDRLPVTPTGPMAGEPGSWLQGDGLKRLLVSLGVVPAGVGASDGRIILGRDAVTVVLDGVVVGGVRDDAAAGLVDTLRRLKVRQASDAPKLDPTMEIAFHPRLQHLSAFPGVFLFTGPGRLVRAVQHLGSGRVEWIGPMEQVFLEIACLAEDVRPETTHAELSPSVMLSHVAALTPYSDYNQSPRNMYQCQMGKQTMGTPAHALKSRSDSKLYRIQTPQAPIVQTETYADYVMDEYSQGTNAVVAVISYTGYDMEDAMIINRAAFQRGFGHGSLYKTTEVDLDEEEKMSARDGMRPSLRFGVVREDPDIPSFLEEDGLPGEGQIIKPGQPICCLVDIGSGKHRVIKHKDSERAVVDSVRILGTGQANKKSFVRKVSITLRYNRNPIIGDKFSSRHGQKGTLSVLWPQENMVRE